MLLFNRNLLRLGVAFLAISIAALAEKPIEPTPGWNFFTKQQDIQLGREAAAQIRQTRAVVNNKELEDYCNRILARLAKSPAADGATYPYRMQVVYDKNVNAFALPGGPMFVFTGLITSAENEAQMAAVFAHEMSHVSLRHGTSQMTKANLIRIPAMIAAGLFGGNGIWGRLTELGVNLAAGSVLLSFSRSAERDADLNGARIMYDAGYDPMQMARFFAKLESQGGRQNQFTEFISDHPNPENRVKVVEQQAHAFTPRKYDNGNPADLVKIKSVVASLPPVASPRRQQQVGQGMPAPAPMPAGPVPTDLHVSKNFQTYEAQGFRIGYPQEWQTYEAARQRTITFAPRDSVFAISNGTAYGYGAQIALFQTAGRADLANDTRRLVQQLQGAAGMSRAGESRTVSVDGQPGLLTPMTSASPYQGEQESDILLTVARPEGLFYVVFFAPKSRYQKIEPIFEQMTTSLKFR